MRSAVGARFQVGPAEGGLGGERPSDGSGKPCQNLAAEVRDERPASRNELATKRRPSAHTVILTRSKWEPSYTKRSQGIFSREAPLSHPIASRPDLITILFEG